MIFPRQTDINSAQDSPSSASSPTSTAISAVQSNSQRASVDPNVSGSGTDNASLSVPTSDSALPSGSSASPQSNASAPSDPPPSQSQSNSQSQSQSQSQQPASQSQSDSNSASQQSSAQPSSSSLVSVSVSNSQSASSVGPSSSSTPISSSDPSSSLPSVPSTPLPDTVSANSVTQSFTTIITNINGQDVTITSALPLPTSLSTAGSSTSTARRTALIAGTTAAGVGIVLILLGAVFVYKRHKGRKREFSEALGRVRREAHGAGGVGLLDEEGFDDDDSVPMRRYTDNAASHNRSQSSLGPPQSPAPSLFRQRAETGSLFREEGVWPPPQGSHFVDPLVGVATGEGMSHIIDDIMGPAPSAHKDDATRGNFPSMSSATSSLYADPFRDMSHTSAPSDPSLYYDRRGASSSSMSAHSQQSSGSRPATPQSLLGLPAGVATTPKKSSPLASVAPPPSSATWLNRSPRKHTRGLSGSQSSQEG